MPDTIPDVRHLVADQVAAMDIQGGVPQMDGWQKVVKCSTSYGYQCIGGYTASQLPNITRLASQFAISDDTFSMADSPSWGGHLYAAMASTDGFTGDNPVAMKGVTASYGWGCNSDRVTDWVSPSGVLTRKVPSCIPDYSLDPSLYSYGGAFKATPAQPHASIFDELDAAGLPWRI